MRERIDEFFVYCKKFRKDTQRDWDYIMNWIELTTRNAPQEAGYVIEKLSDLLQIHGYDIEPERLEAYAQAGWILRLRGSKK